MSRGIGEGVVRVAAPDDAVAMAELLGAAWVATYDGLLPDPALRGRDQDRDADEIRQVIARGGALVLNAGGRLDGLVTFGPPHAQDLGLLEIYAAYVRPELVGTGVGGRLLRRVVATARDAGAAGLLWYVHSGNALVRGMSERVATTVSDLIDRTWLGFPVQVVEYRYEWPAGS